MTVEQKHLSCYHVVGYCNNTIVESIPHLYFDELDAKKKVLELEIRDRESCLDDDNTEPIKLTKWRFVELFINRVDLNKFLQMVDGI